MGGISGFSNNMVQTPFSEKKSKKEKNDFKGLLRLCFVLGCVIAHLLYLK